MFLADSIESFRLELSFRYCCSELNFLKFGKKVIPIKAIMEIDIKISTKVKPAGD
jgi:hypothetical protein